MIDRNTDLLNDNNILLEEFNTENAGSVDIKDRDDDESNSLNASCSDRECCSAVDSEIYPIECLEDEDRKE